MDQEILLALIAAITPVIINVMKKLWAKVPKAIIPWVAPVIGSVATWLAQQAGVEGANVLFGAFAGLAATGLREIVNKSVTQPIARRTTGG